MMCTLNEFIEQYLTLLHTDKAMVDQHFHPISWHLYPITYTNAIELKNLKQDMATIIGEPLASKYFSTPHNASSISSSSYSPGTTSLDLSNISFYELSKPGLFNKSALKASLSVKYRSLLKEIYYDDFKLFSKLSIN